MYEIGKDSPEMALVKKYYSKRISVIYTSIFTNIVLAFTLYPYVFSTLLGVLRKLQKYNYIKANIFSFDKKHMAKGAKMNYIGYFIRNSKNIVSGKEFSDEMLMSIFYMLLFVLAVSLLFMVIARLSPVKHRCKNEDNEVHFKINYGINGGFMNVFYAFSEISNFDIPLVRLIYPADIIYRVICLIMAIVLMNTYGLNFKVNSFLSVLLSIVFVLVSIGLSLYIVYGLRYLAHRIVFADEHKDFSKLSDIEKDIDRETKREIKRKEEEEANRRIAMFIRAHPEEADEIITNAIRKARGGGASTQGTSMSDEDYFASAMMKDSAIADIDVSGM